MVPKEGKRSNSGKILEVVPVLKQGGTGTDQSGTGTEVSKMPRLCSFAYLSLNSCTDNIGT